MRKNILLILIAVFSFIPGLVFAGSVSVSPTNISLNPGDSKTVTVSMSNASGIVTVTPSSGGVSVSNGRFDIDTIGVGSGSKTFTITANQVGNYTVRVNYEQVFDNDTYSPVSGGTTINVTVAATTTTTTTTKATTKAPTPAPAPTPTPNTPAPQTPQNNNNNTTTKANQKTTVKDGTTVPTTVPVPVEEVTDVVETTETTTTTTKASSKDLLLSVFKVVGYDLDYDLNKVNYKLKIDPNVKELYIIASPELESTVVEGIGLVDISSKDIIKVKVTNRDSNNTIEYIIELDRTKEKKNNLFTLILLVIGGGIIGSIITVLVTKKIHKTDINDEDMREKLGFLSVEDLGNPLVNDLDIQVKEEPKIEVKTVEKPEIKKEVKKEAKKEAKTVKTNSNKDVTEKLVNTGIIDIPKDEADLSKTFDALNGR